jgi:hypothetical protein
MQTYTDGAYKAFTANVPADLIGKEGYLVQLRTDGEIELYTNGALIGVLFQRLEGGEEWAVRLLGKGGTVKVVAGGVIAATARVKAASGGKVVTIGTGGRSIGRYLGTSNSADNDVIEILDVLEIGPATAPVVAATGNTDNEIGALSSSATTTQAEFNALRDKCEELGDDVRALRNTVADLVTALTANNVIA